MEAEREGDDENEEQSVLLRGLGLADEPRGKREEKLEDKKPVLTLSITGRRSRGDEQGAQAEKRKRKKEDKKRTKKRRKRKEA